MQELEIIREKIQNKYRVVKTDEDLEWNRAIDLCTNIINAHMKRVNDGWIPVEERQPEYGETVLVRWKKGGILDHSVAQYFGMSWIRDREDFIFITIHGIPHNQGWEPIAWRPLPEPYRPERSTE